MLKLSFKTEYIISAVAIVAFLLALAVREYGHTKQVERLNACIDALTSQLDLQETQIAEAEAKLKAKDAELVAVGKLCASIEAVNVETIQTKEAIHETLQTDEKNALWADAPVPDSILDALHDILCNTTSTDRNKD